MVLKVNRAHAVAPLVKQVTWDFDNGIYVTDKLIDRQFRPVPVNDFAIDVWLAQHGWEVWTDINGVKQRKMVMASVSDELPAQPAGGKPLYTAPVFAMHLGGMRELTVKGLAVTAAFVDLLELFAKATDHIDDELIIPVVEIGRKETDYGLAPLFMMQTVMRRPDTWKPAIVNFK